MPALIRRLRGRWGGEAGFTLVAVFVEKVLIALDTVVSFACVLCDYVY
jgi:hypothetical protein